MRLFQFSLMMKIAHFFPKIHPLNISLIFRIISENNLAKIFDIFYRRYLLFGNRIILSSVAVDCYMIMRKISRSRNFFFRGNYESGLSNYSERLLYTGRSGFISEKKILLKSSHCSLERIFLYLCAMRKVKKR